MEKDCPERTVRDWVHLAQVRVGARIALQSKEQQQQQQLSKETSTSQHNNNYRYGTVTGERLFQQKSFYVEYDDNGKEEWVDLRQEKFVLVKPDYSMLRKKLVQTTEVKTETDAPQSSDNSPMKNAKLPSSPKSSPGKGKTKRSPKNKTISSSEASSQLDDSQPKVHIPEPETRQNASVDEKRGDDTSPLTVTSTAEPEEEKLAKISIGSLLSVYWPDDDQYYDCTVQQIQKQRRKPYYLIYEDGHKEWLQLKNHTFQLRSNDSISAVSTSATKATDERSPKRLTKFSSRDEDTYSAESESSLNGRESVGKARRSVSANKNESAGKGENEDGSSSSASSSQDEDEKQVTIGTRVAVYWDGEDQYFPGIVTRQRKGGRQHFIKYDDGDDEWIDLKSVEYQVIGSADTPTLRTKRQNGSSRVRKRKPLNNEQDEVSNKRLKTADNEPPVKKRGPGRPRKHPIKESNDTKGSKSQKNITSAKKIPKSVTARVPQSAPASPCGSNVKATSATNSTSLEGMKQISDHSVVKVGTRLDVYWPLDKAFYSATVTRTRDTEKSHFLEYDDGEREWINLRKHEYRIIESSQDSESDSDGEEAEFVDDDDGQFESIFDKIKVGSNVEIWWPGDKAYYAANVRKVNFGKKKPFWIVYEDGDEEWINLRDHKYRLIET